MYDDEDDDIEFDYELCEDCPYYRQRPPIGPMEPLYPLVPEDQEPGFGPPQGPGFGPPQGPGFGLPQGPPSGPPPSFAPQLAAQPGIGVQAVDPRAIRRCRYRFVYLMLRNGNEFWAWLTFTGPRSVAGWRWTGFRWVYFGISLRQIVSFYCY